MEMKNEQQMFVRHYDMVNQPRTLTFKVDLQTITGHTLLQKVQKTYPEVVGFIFGGIVLDLNQKLADHHVTPESTLFSLFKVKRT